MAVIGTAGHVDHGKSTLVRALTGIDPDRLKEEKAREMTIDLGFAWLTLPAGVTVGVVDVPGHRDFIENMLAGVGGIDAVIFVVAADEGVMPQTREHLAIIDLLQIPTGVIALTKTDLAPDADWIDLIELDLAETVKGTVLQDAPIIRVSARQARGLDALKDALASVLQARPPASDRGQPRLWIDRTFSVSGFGTVVTGTLLDGSLQVGQEMVILPTGERGRIRGLQSHHHNLDRATAGSRVAVNLSGIERSAVARGMLLTLQPTNMPMITPTRLAGVRFRHLPDAPRPLLHHTEVKLFVGAAETVAHVRLLEGEALAPGETGWLQLDLRDPLPLQRGDRFILRLPSPAITLGGGTVIDAASSTRWRRNKPEVIARLESLLRGTPEDRLIQALDAAAQPQTVAELVAATGFDLDTIQQAALALQRSNRAVEISAGMLNDGMLISSAALTLLTERLTRVLTGFHKANPLRRGMKVVNASQQLEISPASLTLLAEGGYLAAISAVQIHGTVFVFATAHQPQPSRAQKLAIEQLSARFAAAPYTPPSVKEAIDLVGAEVLACLVENGDLRQLNSDVLFTEGVFTEMIAATREMLETEGAVNVRNLRDRFATSRKYALAVLEYLNSLGLTKRQGDDHVQGTGAWDRLG